MPSANTDSVVFQPIEATIYDWKWYYSAPGFALWLALTLAIFLPKANRDISVILILVPLVLISLIWSLVERITGMPSATAVQFGTVVQSLAVGTAVLWLVGGYLLSLRGLIRCLAAFATIVLVGACGILSYSTEFSNETALFMVFLIFLAGTLLASITLARTMCRGRYGPRRLMAWLALWTLVISMMAALGFRIAGELVISSSPSLPQLSEVLIMIFVAGPVLGLGLYLLNLPFMILGFVNPLFRERLCSCLRLESVEPTLTADANIMSE
ncbi:MAG: hypothetical protein JSW47_13565 [Phycisphaerales bacterium]|nr:MAG: hypothetical protein JSW47_13565 [Phycisphaerales bacterium]